MDVDFETLKKSYYDGPLKRNNCIIKNNSELNNFFEELSFLQLDYPPIPKINFSDNIVIAVARGGCPSEGYGIEIKKLRKDNGKLEVLVEETNPINDVLTDICTYPYHIIKTKKHEGEISFIIISKI